MLATARHLGRNVLTICLDAILVGFSRTGGTSAQAVARKRRTFAISRQQVLASRGEENTCVDDFDTGVRSGLVVIANGQADDYRAGKVRGQTCGFQHRRVRLLRSRTITIQRLVRSKIIPRPAWLQPRPDRRCLLVKTERAGEGATQTPERYVKARTSRVRTAGVPRRPCCTNAPSSWHRLSVNCRKAGPR